MTKETSIYMVDDDSDDFILFNEMILEKYVSVKLTHFVSSYDFLKQCKDLSIPHLIVLDINMPKYNGFEVMRHLKSLQQWKFIPMIFLSTSNDESLKRKAISEGATMYFTKPSTVNDWKHMIELVYTTVGITI